MEDALARAGARRTVAGTTILVFALRPMPSIRVSPLRKPARFHPPEEVPVRPVVYHALSLVVASGLCASALVGQRPAKSTISDAELIAREAAYWKAMTAGKEEVAKEMAKYPAPGPLLLVTPEGIGRIDRPADMTADIMKRCETRAATMDSAKVDRLGPETAVLTYTLSLDRTCPPLPKIPSPLYVMSVWAYRGGHWESAAQSYVLPDTAMQAEERKAASH